MDSFDFSPFDFAIVGVEGLVVLVPPVVLWLERVRLSAGLEDPILVNIFDLQPRDRSQLFGEMRRFAPFYRLFQYLLPSVHPSLSPLTVYVADLEGVSDEFVARVHQNL